MRAWVIPVGLNPGTLSGRAMGSYTLPIWVGCRYSLEWMIKSLLGSAGLDEPDLEGVRYRFGAILSTQFLQNVTHVVFDGVLADQ